MERGQVGEEKKINHYEIINTFTLLARSIFVGDTLFGRRSTGMRLLQPEHRDVVE
jgi:hypothetical protein